MKTVRDKETYSILHIRMRSAHRVALKMIHREDGDTNDKMWVGGKRNVEQDQMEKTELKRKETEGKKGWMKEYQEYRWSIGEKQKERKKGRLTCTLLTDLNWRLSKNGDADHKTEYGLKEEGERTERGVKGGKWRKRESKVWKIIRWRKKRVELKDNETWQEHTSILLTCMSFNSYRLSCRIVRRGGGKQAFHNT